MIKTAFLGLAALLALPAGHTAPSLHDGYAILTEPAHPADLAQTIYVEVRGATVLDGILEILQGTGYRLARLEAADPEIGRLYEQPYPASQRTIGPSALGVALERLAGPAWQLVEDPVNRRVSFEVKADFRPTPAGGAPVRQAAQAPAGLAMEPSSWGRDR